MLILLSGGPGAGEVVEQEIDTATPDAVVELGDYSGGMYCILGRLPPGRRPSTWPIGR
jgi:hypothetical protein